MVVVWVVVLWHMSTATRCMVRLFQSGWSGVRSTFNPVRFITTHGAPHNHGVLVNPVPNTHTHTQHAWLQVFVERSHQACGWWHTRPRGGWHGVIVARHHQQAPNTTTTLVGQKHKGGVVVHLNCFTARTTTTSIGVSVNSVFHTFWDNRHQQQQQVSTRGVVVLA